MLWRVRLMLLTRRQYVNDNCALVRDWTITRLPSRISKLRCIHPALVGVPPAVCASSAAPSALPPDTPCTKGPS